MLINVIRTEALKLRRSPVWIAFVLLPLLSAVMGTFNYLQNLDLLTKEWYSLWTQHTLFSAFFFMPSLIGILCACQWRVEHRHNNWNTLMTLPVPTWVLCVGKLTVTMGMLLLVHLWTALLFFLSGRFAGIGSALPAQLAVWLAMSFCGGCAIAAVQLFLSMRIRSFAIPVGIALAGGVVGMVLANVGYGLYFPYSLMAMGMNANGSGSVDAAALPTFFIMCVVWIALPVAASIETLKRRDIVTG